jgi:hypothetical protein
MTEICASCGSENIKIEKEENVWTKRRTLWSNW